MDRLNFFYERLSQITVHLLALVGSETRSVRWSVGRFVGRPVIVSLKSGKLHLHAPFGDFFFCFASNTRCNRNTGVLFEWHLPLLRGLDSSVRQWSCCTVWSVQPNRDPGTAIFNDFFKLKASISTIFSHTSHPSLTSWGIFDLLLKGFITFWEFSFYWQKKIADYEFHSLFAEKIHFPTLILIFCVLKPRSFYSNLGFEHWK